MTFWTPETVRAAVRGGWTRRPPTQTVPLTGVSVDSRTIKPGQVFVALRGERHDGHDHLGSAAEAGSPLLVVDDRGRATLDTVGPATGIIGVADTGRALLDFAAAYRSSLTGTKVVAVCGSNGKTTTTRLIDRVLGSSLRGRASVKSFNNAVGVPLTVLSAREDDEYLVCEVGTSAPGEIAMLAGVLSPDIVVITSIGREHLEKLKDLAGVAAEEASILRHLRPGGLAVATADSPELAGHLEGMPGVVTFGLSERADLRLTALEYPEAGGVEFTINGRRRGRLPLLGEHNALNAIAAIAVARGMGVQEEPAVAALAGATGAEMRLSVCEFGGISVLNDAYNANPDSMIAGLRTLADLRRARGGGVSRAVAILGDMLELGGSSDEGHRAVARAAVETGRVDLIVLVGQAMIAARDELVSMGWPGDRLAHFSDCDEPHDRQIAALLRAGDLVLVKGSRKVRLERVVDSLRGGTLEEGPEGPRDRAAKGRRGRALEART